MPGITFELPHWLYWGGLLIFPLLAMWLVRREYHHGRPPEPSHAVGYLLWLTGGFVGLHRFYVGSLLGLLYIPLFLAILAGNVYTRDARLELSAANNDIDSYSFLLERAVNQEGEGSEAAAEARANLEAAQARLAAAEAAHDRAQGFTGLMAGIIALWLVIDALLLPRMIRRRRARPGRSQPPDLAHREDPGRTPPMPHGFWRRLTWGIDRISGHTGHFVAYWSLIAVFVYYFEVLSRYVFNSPTNWAHESMFLMFGMQYVISGAYALREDSHVRVDVLYLYLPRRGQAALDVFTSIFFFIFVGALLWTGWTFASDSINVWEVSFTEWAIQYWPVKLAIPVGAALILLQGIAKLIRDITVVLTGQEA